MLNVKPLALGTSSARGILFAPSALVLLTHALVFCFLPGIFLPCFFPRTSRHAGWCRVYFVPVVNLRIFAWMSNTYVWQGETLNEIPQHKTQEARSISPRSREPRSPIKADTFDTCILTRPCGVWHVWHSAQVVRREARHGAAPEDAPTSPLRPKDLGITSDYMTTLSTFHSKTLQTWIIWCHVIRLNIHW